MLYVVDGLVVDEDDLGELLFPPLVNSQKTETRTLPPPTNREHLKYNSVLNAWPDSTHIRPPPALWNVKLCK